ncbi:STAS domain-containing protein [Rhodocyclus tenuis]|uniref:STAS domain-containing protein n=2 Tax=Rhodocyclus TaxID=1064 RepID=A0A6L5JX07_RHOTE|nr:STAS domain-containing protein [Rhodocyclus gracilis]MQY51759.1 STAS domain-containing protein [Rhodocyclus gracilis]NJA88980.1 STAS domain-containing protein [Rhodocyclus gracilis]
MAGTNRITLIDDLTIYHAEAQKQLLLDALAAPGAVEADLSQAGEIDTAGLQLLILAKREALRQGKDFHIVAHSPAVRQTIDFCNLTAFFGDPVVIPAHESP